MTSVKRLLPWLVALLLLAFATRLFDLGAQSLWFDEGWSAYAALQPDLIAAANADATNPPLYYMLINLHTRIAGDSEFSLRLLSLWLSLLTIPLAYQLARRLVSARAGVWAAAAAVLLPLLWWSAREARMYSWLALLAIIAALSFHTLIVKPSRRAWVGLWLAELALLYSHNTGPIVVLWLNLAVLIVWLAARSFSKPDVRVWLFGQIGVGLLWLPYLLGRFLLLPEANAGLQNTTLLTPQALSNLWRAFWETPWERILFGAEVSWPFLLLLLLLAILLPYRWKGARWLLLHAAVWIAGIWIGLAILGNEFHGRYLVVAAPFIAVLAGMAIARLPVTPLRWTAGVVLLAVFGANFVYNLDPPFRHDDARTLVQHYADTLAAGDSVIAWSYADRYELAYYWDRLHPAARRITLPEGADLEAVLPLLPSSGDVALNVWYTQRADYRGMLDCLLSSGTSQPPEVLDVYGMSSRLYRSPSLQAPQFVPADIQVMQGQESLAQIDQLGELPSQSADQALCLPVMLSLLQPVNADLKAAVIVHNALGWEIARADAPFATADQRTTSAAQMGEPLAAFALLRLPAGTPAGEYQVTLRVYDELMQPSGFPLRQNGLPVLGRDTVLGTWTVASGDWGDSAVDLPVALAQPVGDLTLIAHDVVPATLRNGDALRLTLLWQGTGTLPPLLLQAVDESWQIELLPETTEGINLTRDWREGIIPAGAQSGEAVLRLPDGAELARFTIESVPAEYAIPASDVALEAVFNGVGSLIGANLPERWSLENPPQVELIWQAGDSAASTAYTVFVQLLDAEGRVIAQSDSQPSSGARPTTGWRQDEIIRDLHTLQYNEFAAPGSAILIAGFYDPLTGERVQLADGSDFAAIPGDVSIQPS